jgi:ornithine decarboxylase
MYTKYKHTNIYKCYDFFFVLKNEMKNVLKWDVDGDRIIFAHTAKWPSHIKYANQVGVRKMTFDSLEELEKVQEHFPQAQLLLRIRSPDNYAKHGLSTKFGADLEDVPSLLEHVRRLNLTLVGVSFHVGSDAYSSVPYAISIENARKVFEAAHSKGFDLKFLDIGGGFTATADEGKRFPKLAAEINEVLDKLFSPEGNVTIISEPGKFFSETPFYLATQVILTRLRNSTLHLYLTDGTAGSFRVKTFAAYKSWEREEIPLPLWNFKGREMKRTQLWGPTCDSLDVAGNTLLLPEIRRGEWLLFRNWGAYTLAEVTKEFNGLPVPAVKIYHLTPKAAGILRKNTLWPQICMAMKSDCPDVA